MRTRALWRFDEAQNEQRPIDAIGAVAELGQVPASAMTADAMRLTVGGRWRVGYLCDENAGNLTAIFGTPASLIATGAITYGLPGARGPSDKAIRIEGGNNRFATVDTTAFEVTGTDDLVGAWIGKWTAAVDSDLFRQIISKVEGGFASGWTLYSNPDNNVVLSAKQAAGTQRNASCARIVGEPHAGLFVIGRAANVMTVGIVGLVSGQVALGTVVAPGAENFSAPTAGLRFGASPWIGRAQPNIEISEWYLGAGPGAATGVADDFAGALARWAASIVSRPSVVDAAAGRGRSFVALSRHGFEAADVVSGSTLLTRDASVQALVRWDLGEQGASTLWTLTKTGGSGAAYDAGASSVETIAADGYVEITVANVATARYFGLSDVDVDATNTTIDYAIRYDVTDYSVVENGVQKLTISGVVAGDVLRVERVGATVLYKRNGVTYYTSIVPSAGPLRIDTSFLNAGTTLEGIRLVDAGVRKAITWQNLVNVTATPTENVAGTLYVRGKATGSAEYVNAGVELRVVNASRNVGEIRWLWQDTAGVLKRQLGGQFQAPADGSYIMLTATRRWVASNKVLVRYFMGDRMLAEVESVDGSIGGGTTGTTTIGARFDGAKWVDFFDGVIDELRVVDYELAPEEIAATWARISKLQPAAYRAIRDLLPPDAPISSDPSSRIQKLLNLVGNALGYAAAQTENFRNNLLPDRAFGTALERWERITEEPPKALDSIDQRRARVVGHLRQRAGASMSGVTAAVKDLLQLSETQVQFLAFDNTVREDWSHGLRTELWDAQPPAQWTIAANALRVQAANGATLKFDDGQSRGWYTCFAPALGSTNLGVPNQPGRYDGAACRIYAEFTPTTLPANGEVGVAFYNLARGHALLFGLRNNAGVYQVITQRFVDWLSQGVTVRAVSALEAHLLLLFAQPGGGALLPVTDALFTATWSSGSSGVSSYTNIQHRKEFSYMGIYARSFGPGALAGALDVSFNNVWLRWGMGTRPMRFYVYRDPALAGAPDRNAAHHVIQRLKQAHTEATVISSTSVLCDSASHGCDREPMGGF